VYDTVGYIRVTAKIEGRLTTRTTTRMLGRRATTTTTTTTTTMTRDDDNNSLSDDDDDDGRRCNKMDAVTRPRIGAGFDDSSRLNLHADTRPAMSDFPPWTLPLPLRYVSS